MKEMPQQKMGHTEFLKQRTENQELSIAIEKARLSSTNHQPVYTKQQSDDENSDSEITSSNASERMED